MVMVMLFNSPHFDWIIDVNCYRLLLSASSDGSDDWVRRAESSTNRIEIISFSPFFLPRQRINQLVCIRLSKFRLSLIFFSPCWTSFSILPDQPVPRHSYSISRPKLMFILANGTILSPNWRVVVLPVLATSSSVC